MVTMTKNLADAHGAEGIRVNLFNVGWTLTPNEYELKMREGLTGGLAQPGAQNFRPLRPDPFSGGHRLGGRLFPFGRGRAHQWRGP